MTENKFKVGDRVRVKTKRHGEYQFGKNGSVTEVDRIKNSVGILDIEVEFEKCDRNYYDPEDLELINSGGPIQTKRVLVPGVYGALKVQEYTNDLLRIDLESCVLDANELDQLSSVASQLADFLRGERK